MSSFSNIQNNFANVEKLERELHLKQLQINRLLNITQAINNNVPADGLFEMYQSFLSWEMRVKKMALYFRDDNGKWNCAASIGLSDTLLSMDITLRLSEFNRLKNIEDEKHPLIKEFEVVIPVLHKEESLAYVFIGGFSEEEDMYNKVQFITTITNIIAVAIENKRLFNQRVEQESLRRDMELAGQMQRMLIPDNLPKGVGFELASIYKPHIGVGGDYFDFIQLEECRFAFCVADISGKGVAAALLMANFQATFHSLIRQGHPLDVFVHTLNELVLRITHGEKFITFFIAEYDERNRVMRYVNAGHNPPALVMNGEITRLDEGCTILGSFHKLPSLDVGEVRVSDEAIILSYTDGLTDIQNDSSEYFDEALVEQFLQQNYRLNAEAFNEELMEQITKFKKNEPYPDDLTVLTCKIY